MFKLTREVRFSLSPSLAGDAVPNGHAGFPQVSGGAPFLRAQLTYESDLNPRSQYVLDIKQIDQLFRAAALPLLQRRFRFSELKYNSELMKDLWETLVRGLRAARLAQLVLLLSPYHSLSRSRVPGGFMTALHLRFEFSAAHRLHNPKLSAAENLALFGKCNNPHGHGHNYELQVSVSHPHPSVPELERVVHDCVIRPYDHKHLNVEVEDFKETNPTVENIARAAFDRLKPALGTALISTTVWETPKTWAEYSEP